MPLQADNPVFDPVTMDLLSIDAEFPPAIHEITFESRGSRLPSILMTANGAGPHPTVILLHGYPGNEKNLDLGQSMRRAGFNVLFFHYRGAWGAEGNFAFTHLKEDVATALGFLRAKAEAYRVDKDKLSLVGHSMGGFVALKGASQDPGVVCTVGLAAANLGYLAEQMISDPGLRSGFTEGTRTLYMLSGFDGEASVAEMIENRTEYDTATFGPALAGKSVLLITGTGDTIIPPAVQAKNVEAYEKTAGLKLSHHLIPGDHSFSQSRIELQRLVVTWLMKECG
jgi:pimeloyl-ACP methyl ester carboxylesterase